MRPLLLALLLAGCTVDTAPAKKGGKGGGGGTTADDVLLETATWDQTSSRDGLVEVWLDVPEGATSFQITGWSPQAWVSLEELVAPDGTTALHWEDWWTSPYSLTNAFFGYDHVTAFSWPIRDVDGPLEPGQWTVVLSTLDAQGYYRPNTATDLFLHVKHDEDLAAAEVEVLLVWADGVKGDADVVAAVEAGVERWREIWSAYGIDLAVRYVESDLDPNLGFTYTGSDDVAAVAAAKEDGELIVVVGESILDEMSTYGISAGIPGTLAATPNTFVVLSWLTHAGPDGAFSDEDVRILGETMAHEASHYMGLFHPVEANYIYWDAIDDTPDCTSWQECDPLLGDNLMYPYPVCDGSGCVPADQMTGGQLSVSNGYGAAL